MADWFVTLPIYNEVNHVHPVLDEVKQFADHIVVVNDGSSDGTAAELAKRDDITVLTHEKNQGYGAALITAFDYAIKQDFEGLVTIDCDGQHQPKLIPRLIEKLFQPADPVIDVVSGSRYLEEFSNDVAAPEDRRKINFEITKQLNEMLGFQLTDTFCGFKAYRTEALAKLDVTETGYAMPLQFWIQAACADLKIIEYPVPRIYLEEERSFGGSLDDSRRRMAHYQEVIERERARVADECGKLGNTSSMGV